MTKIEAIKRGDRLEHELAEARRHLRVADRTIGSMMRLTAALTPSRKGWHSPELLKRAESILRRTGGRPYLYDKVLEVDAANQARHHAHLAPSGAIQENREK